MTPQCPQNEITQELKSRNGHFLGGSVVQWLSHHPSNADSAGSIPGGGTKISCAKRVAKKKEKKVVGAQPILVVLLF